MRLPLRTSSAIGARASPPADSAGSGRRSARMRAVNERVCVLSTSLAGGGAEKVAVNLANLFSRNDVPVDLVLMQSHGPYRDRIGARVNVVDLNGSRVRHSII